MVHRRVPVDGRRPWRPSAAAARRRAPWAGRTATRRRSGVAAAGPAREGARREAHAGAGVAAVEQLAAGTRAARAAAPVPPPRIRYRTMPSAAVGRARATAPSAVEGARRAPDVAARAERCGRRPRPSPRASNSSARWPIDLSPGSRSSPAMRGGRLDATGRRRCRAPRGPGRPPRPSRHDARGVETLRRRPPRRIGRRLAPLRRA